MNRRDALSRMLGAPMALALTPVVMAGENMEPVRPIRQKPYIESNPHEPDYDCCPQTCCEPSSFTVSVDVGDCQTRYFYSNGFPVGREVRNKHGQWVKG